MKNRKDEIPPSPSSDSWDVLFSRLWDEIAATDARIGVASCETNWGKSERLEGRRDGLLIAVDLLRETRPYDRSATTL
jgi:hypothetical protein